MAADGDFSDSVQGILAGDDVGRKATVTQGNFFTPVATKSLEGPTYAQNAVCATTKHDVYLCSNYSIKRWSPIFDKVTEVLNCSSHLVPAESHPGPLQRCTNRSVLSTLDVKNDFVVAGGTSGEIVCKCLRKPGVSFCTKAENGISCIEIFDRNGGLHFLTSIYGVSGEVREYEMESFQQLNNFYFPWPVFHTSVSPDRKNLIVVGGNNDGFLVDSQTGETLATLVGHKDRSYASAWHPDGVRFATGSDDKTCMLWDRRNLSSSVEIFRAESHPLRSLRFSADGKFLVVAEKELNVHIFYVDYGFIQRQDMKVNGMLCGISMSQCDNALFLGAQTGTQVDLFEYRRRRFLFGSFDPMPLFY